MAKATKFLLIAIVALFLLVPFWSVSAGPQIRFVIVKGSSPPGSPLFQLGDGLARLISRHIPNIQATAEVRRRVFWSHASSQKDAPIWH